MYYDLSIAHSLHWSRAAITAISSRTWHPTRWSII